MANAETLGFEDIRRLLPQSHPFLMIDRVAELVPGERIVGVKNVSGNETFFQGHFPTVAIMPAALILEALAQATIVLARRTAQLRGAPPPSPGQEDVYLFGSVHAKMHRPVFPGDVLRLEVKLLKMFPEGGAAEGKAVVDGNPCTQAEMYFSRVRLADLLRPKP
ncbi:MAG TPA: 3-hydroxyacyl-ACP dehydratase FabZ [Planctomycetota bacterium]|jgi:3-hydroxyacyl-[acyl-carrier-protein] dehydratase|nr:3-hydroxyacyl-ACP dehydratase FabZ [Planctomycetota bacterium]